MTEGASAGMTEGASAGMTEEGRRNDGSERRLTRGLTGWCASLSWHCKPGWFAGVTPGEPENTPAEPDPGNAGAGSAPGSPPRPATAPQPR